MQKIHKKNNGLKIIMVFIISIFLVIFNPYNFFSPVRSFLHTVFMPVVQVGYMGGNKFNDITTTLKSVGTLKQDNQKLHKENLELKSQINELKDIANENRKLREEINLLPKEDLKFLESEVIVKDISNKNDWFEINRGSNDGLKKDFPVIVGQKNLIGFVNEVFPNQSRVKLINHPDSVVNVVTIESDIEAIARGEHGTSIVVENIDQDAKIETGMTFITSQISGKFPRGLSVGVVQSVSTTTDGLFKTARINSLVDFDEIRFVSVIIE